MNKKFIVSTFILLLILLIGSSLIKKEIPSEEILDEGIRSWSGFRSINPDNDPVHSGVFVTMFKNLGRVIPLKIFKTSRQRISINLYILYLKILKFTLYNKIQLIIAGSIVLILTFIFLKLKIFFAASFLARFSYFISRVILAVLGIFILFSWILVKYDFQYYTGIFHLIGPIMFLILASISVKIYDINYPLWNRTLKSIILPVICSFLMIGSNFMLDPELFSQK